MSQITLHNLDRLSVLELQELFEGQGISVGIVEPQPVPGQSGLLQSFQLFLEHNDHVPLLLTIWLVSRMRVNLKISGKTKTLDVAFSGGTPVSILKQLKDFLSSDGQ